MISSDPGIVHQHSANGSIQLAAALQTSTFDDFNLNLGDRDKFVILVYVLLFCKTLETNICGEIQTFLGGL